MAGAPCRPSRSTFHPRSRSNAWRAAARQVKCAIWHPVVKAKDADRGKSSTSLIQALATSSTMAEAGPQAWSAALLSQVEASQSAASAEGSAPPITQAKKRPPADPRCPPSVEESGRAHV